MSEESTRLCWVGLTGLLIGLILGYESTRLCWVGLTGLLIGLILGYPLGGALSEGWAQERADAYWRDAAVEAGHAEYYLDEEHQRQWQWLPSVVTDGSEQMRE